MEFLTEVQENLGSPLVGCKLVRACIDFWTDEIIMPDDSAVLPKIMRVFSRKIVSLRAVTCDELDDDSKAPRAPSVFEEMSQL